MDDAFLNWLYPTRTELEVGPAQHDGIGFLGNGLEVEEGLPRLTLGNQLQARRRLCESMCSDG